MDKIIINGLKLFAYHGVHDFEKQNGQTFILDITLYIDMSLPCKTDNVNDTVSYSEVIKTVKTAFISEKYDLIERAAEVCADAIFENFSKVRECVIMLKKPEAPIKEDFSYVGVEIRRERHE